jgi:hypothetical protein
MNARFHVLSMLFLILLAACAALPPVPQASATPAGSDNVAPASSFDWDERSTFVPGLIESQQGILDELPGASVYDMELTIADDLLELDGSLEVRYTNQELVPLDEVFFRLYPNLLGGHLAVSSVKVDGADASPEYLSMDSTLRIPLPEPLAPGERVMIGFDFSVEVSQEMTASYGLFGFFDEVLALMSFYPIIATYDAAGWDVDFPSVNGDLSYSDISFYRVRICASPSLTLVASGVEVDRAMEGDKLCTTVAAGPIRDFYFAASERFIVESTQMGETTINSYVLEEVASGAAQSLVYAEAALRSYSARLGAYPYTEFDMVSTPMQSLGMEYPGVVANLDLLYDEDEMLYGMPALAVLESVVAHEVAHQWLYNLVGSDQMDEPWLDEALTQYVTGLYFIDTGGPEAFQGYRQSWFDRWDRVERAEIPIGLHASDYAPGEYSPIVYGRGPLFVEALADRMGEAVFAEFLRDYVETYAWQIATGEDFRALAEAHCGCDLTDLFKEWVYE